MREIKFRVYAHTKDDDGCIGYLETRSPAASGINFFFDAGWRGVSYFLQRAESFTVQQYTGAKDRNGREIYEGDIVKFGMSTDQTNAFPKLRFVEFYQPQLIYKIVEVGGLPAQVDYLYEAVGTSTRWCEVVGNIFENPELLKSEKKN